MASLQPYRPDPLILTLGDDFYDPVMPADFPQTIERYFNAPAAASIGLADLGDAARIRHFARFEPFTDNLPQPLALRYHGHQFRHYNPDLGDGRGFLFAQVRDGAGRLLDLATKGSGQTPYSRRGDGRLTLKGGVREILATEWLEALGVNTSRSFSLFETGEELTRGDEPSPTRSAVLTRLGHGHIRIGTFQRFAFHDERGNLAALTRYCLENLYGEPAGGDADNAARLFDLVAESTARLAASYMAAGFVHGVLNSDNIAITGESFDYGPWRFTPYWDNDFVAAYFDHQGLYAFGRQPQAIHWNLAQLGGALSLLVDADRLDPILNSWTDRFDRHIIEAMLGRLGIALQDPDTDRKIVQAIVAALSEKSATIDAFFHDWRGGHDPGSPYDSDAFRALATLLDGRATARSAYWDEQPICSLHIEEVEAIWAAIDTDDDWALLSAKIDAFRAHKDALGDAMHP